MTQSTTHQDALCSAHQTRKLSGRPEPVEVSDSAGCQRPCLRADILSETLPQCYAFLMHSAASKHSMTTKQRGKSFNILESGPYRQSIHLQPFVVEWKAIWLYTVQRHDITQQAVGQH